MAVGELYSAAAITAEAVGSSSASSLTACWRARTKGLSSLLRLLPLAERTCFRCVRRSAALSNLLRALRRRGGGIWRLFSNRKAALLAPTMEELPLEV
jgi:hypothetical protein